APILKFFKTRKNNGSVVNCEQSHGVVSRVESIECASAAAVAAEASVSRDVRIACAMPSEASCALKVRTNFAPLSIVPPDRSAHYVLKRDLMQLADSVRFYLAVQKNVKDELFTREEEALKSLKG